MHENISTRKCHIGLDARKFSSAKISTFTVTYFDACAIRLRPIHRSLGWQYLGLKTAIIGHQSSCYSSKPDPFFDSAWDAGVAIDSSAHPPPPPPHVMVLD